MMTLKEAVKKVRPLDEKAMEGAKQRWDSIAKPLHSLGELENMLTQIAGITGTASASSLLPCRFPQEKSSETA